MSKWLVPVVVAWLGLSAPVRAALYDFTIGGQVTQSSYPNVNVGDPFAIRYTANSREYLDPLNALYPASDAVVTFPGATFDSYYESAVGVYLNNLGMNRVFYRTPSEVFLFDVEMYFPIGTLASNALPLTLPMDRATSATLRLTDYLGSVRGTLATYESVEIPEPVAMALPAFPLFVSRAYKRMGLVRANPFTWRVL